MIQARLPKIVGVSDVSLGYGSPQMPTLVESLAEHYGPCQAIVIEPDQSERPPRPERFPTLTLNRLSTRHSPFSRSGFVEYNIQVAKLLNSIRPDVLVVSSSAVLPALHQLRYRPKATIYYLLESLTYYANGSDYRSRFILDLNRRVAPLIDLVIFPEENRAIRDVQRAGFHGIPMVVCYNAVNRLSQLDEVAPWNRRRPCILYSGSIDRRLTLADYFVRDEIDSAPIDLWGLIEGADKSELEAAFRGRNGAVRYRGYVDSMRLGQLRKEYSYSLVLWAPIDDNFLYACPNKFFEAIADGVPPIAAPHPQCQMLIDRYDCGISMEDWSFSSFQAAISAGQRLFGTPRYAELVNNCRRAVQQELSWDAQFAKVKRLLPQDV